MTLNACKEVFIEDRFPIQTIVITMKEKLLTCVKVQDLGHYRMMAGLEWVKRVAITVQCPLKPKLCQGRLQKEKMSQSDP